LAPTTAADLIPEKNDDTAQATMKLQLFKLGYPWSGFSVTKV